MRLLSGSNTGQQYNREHYKPQVPSCSLCTRMCFEHTEYTLSTMTNKDRWPELVGKNYEEAAKQIRKDKPHATVSKHSINGIMTADCKCSSAQGTRRAVSSCEQGLRST